MSSFFDDLIASDETLAKGDPATDATVRALIAQAAQDGSIKTLRQAIQRGQIHTSTDQEIVDAAVHVIGSDRSALRLNNKEMERRISFVQEWVDAVAGPRPSQSPEALAQWNVRTGSMLGACFSGYMSGHDHVAGELVQMGVPSNGKFQKAEQGAMTQLSGARLDTHEETASVTVLGKAIQNRSRWIQNMVAQDPEGLPVVATVKVGDKTQEVNAAGYALVLGDTKALREILSGLPKHFIQQRDAMEQKLGAAIDQAAHLGLLDFGPDEVVHGVAMLLAAGAKMKNPSAFLARTITIVDVPGLANDPLATKEQAQEVSEAVQSRTYHLPAAMLYAPHAADAIAAIKSMKHMGWDVNQPLQPGSSLDGDQVKKATCAHLAALNCHEDVVATLKFLGCDMARDDGKGNQPIDYARAGALSRGLSFDLDYARVFDATYMPRPGDAIPGSEPHDFEDLSPSDRYEDDRALFSHPAPEPFTPSPSSTQTPSTSTLGAKRALSIDEVNAQAMMAAGEDNDREPYDYAGFDDEVVPASLGASSSKKAASASPIVVAQAPAEAPAPATAPRPMSPFERLKAAHAARDALAGVASFSARP